MKRLSILAGLAMLALATPTPSEAACNNWDTECLKKEAAQGQQGWPKEMPAECTGYGAANTKPAHCAQWEGWQPGMPPPGQGTPGQGTGTWQPPPGQQKPPPGTGTTWTPDQVMCPKNSVWDQQAQRCLFKKADTTTQRCQPGWVWVTYGNKGKCVKRGGTQEQTGQQCRPGWVYSPRLYKCVPGTVGGGTDQQQGHRCGYGKVWSDQYGRCVRFGGGTDGGQQSSQGGYGCRPWERWSNRRQTCVPRGGGGDVGTYGNQGGTYGNQGIPGINIYIGGGKKKRGGDDYGNRGGGRHRGGGGDYGYRGSGGNDYRGRGR